ncbi:MAG: DUF2764 family protein [Sphingobacteriia bacterium]|nr:DUF2764 family protein [Sphingobacteriia bacterium]
MSKLQYFYLIAGLPDLSITDTRLPFTAKTFLNELQNKVHPKDFELVCWLYYARDHHNLLGILFNRNSTMQTEGCYSIGQLKKAVESNTVLPGYMSTFIFSFRENKDRYKEAEWEVRLSETYYREVMKCGNDFLTRWMEFELNLKNLLLILSNKKQELPFSAFILEANEMACMFKQDLSADFSTETSLGFLNTGIKILETENIIEREKKIDLLRWKQLEEMTFFNYFTVEAVMSFIIKLMIIERWITLKQGHEKLYLPSMLDTLIEKVEIT